ncbi:peptidylprolyl isomerase [Zunongwangia endophytica]|uniref:Peptidyl-prolyl cis-trans isomerase n=1 Tax=Zunongwangia endophytica TaxID=1808945 RepID=A0ABV8HBU4_9FLAO|nr:peptidylprolyl isomerase [Zunongwangia endophytica]MDN3593793.1 peptidylprolyl isomerase [Zunongwangia endophytica]
MFKRVSVIVILVVSVFASCEDKKTSGENNSENTSEAVKNSIKSEDSAKNKVDSSEIENNEQKIKTAKDTAFPIQQEKLIPFLTEYGKKNPENKVRITTSFGSFEVTLYRDTPLHRANFIMLIKNNYFNNTYFHRVAPNFVIQGGNSDNASTNKKRYAIGDYLIPNELNAGHTHNRGAFSAAKYAEQNTSKASSPFEFFVVLNPNGAHHLDDEHTVYGYVSKGMDVVDKISQVETGQSEWPIDNIEMQVEIIE